MAVGHVYYFLEDVFPYQRGGRRLLVTPQWLKTICDPAPGKVNICSGFFSSDNSRDGNPNPTKFLDQEIIRIVTTYCLQLLWHLKKKYFHSCSHAYLGKVK